MRGQKQKLYRGQEEITLVLMMEVYTQQTLG